MKKLLGFLSIFCLTATTGSSAIACTCQITEEQEKVVEELLKFNGVKITVGLNTTIKNITKLIDGNFIKKQLEKQGESEILKNFNSKDFKTQKIIKSNNKKWTN